MAKFIQVIEFQTSRLAELQALSEETAQARQGGTVQAITVAADRDRPNHYRTVAIFDSYESAMENSQRPETQAFAKRMAELCDAPPVFHNLDVMDEWAR